ncbi:YadA C-terminal domain-containing protein, partial [Phascolarctobacterium succinatutens]|uniref:YadA C-terminal domain-containing protein n=1 Tax=Phascolarctobacterium succinatutens TaxID=626940 RepID=UPI0026F2DCD6
IATKAYGMAQTEQVERKIADLQIREDMKKADKDLSDRIDDNKKIATKAYGMAQTEQVERKIADLQIREDMKKADKDLSDKIDKETNERKFGEFALNTKIDAEGQARIKNDKILDGKIDAETANRKAEVARLDGEVSRLDSRIDKLDANVEKVGAMAAAIANLHTMGYDPEAPTEIAVGVGQYRDKTGMALGAFHYPNRDFMLSFSVSTAGDEFMGGIGATWKFGRKSPEELRQAEAEKAAKAKLAKAEAAKKAAKDARVAAQQKRHAEMLAARTGK